MRRNEIAEKIDNVQIHDDYVEIDSRKNAKEIALAILAISPLCLFDWVCVWAGWQEPDEPKITSCFLIALVILSLIGAAVEGSTTFRFDRKGATRKMFINYVVFIPWEEMKYIGACMAPATRFGARQEILLSKVPYSKFMKYNTTSHRWYGSRTVIRLLYIDDELYEKILELSGGERNIE